jgi:hypothetical protein
MCCAAVTVAAMVAVASIAPLPASATTEPAATFFDHVAVTDKGITLSLKKVDVGVLVVFIVRNQSSHPRRVVVGSYKSGVLPPGKQIEFELSFPVPWAFKIRSSGNHLPTLTAKFVCSF